MLKAVAGAEEAPSSRGEDQPSLDGPLPSGGATHEDIDDTYLHTEFDDTVQHDLFPSEIEERQRHGHQSTSAAGTGASGTDQAVSHDLSDMRTRQPPVSPSPTSALEERCKQQSETQSLLRAQREHEAGQQGCNDGDLPYQDPELTIPKTPAVARHGVSDQRLLRSIQEASDENFDGSARSRDLQTVGGKHASEPGGYNTLFQSHPPRHLPSVPSLCWSPSSRQKTEQTGGSEQSLNFPVHQRHSRLWHHVCLPPESPSQQANYDGSCEGSERLSLSLFIEASGDLQSGQELRDTGRSLHSRNHSISSSEVSYDVPDESSGNEIAAEYSLQVTDAPVQGGNWTSGLEVDGVDFLHTQNQFACPPNTQ